VISSPQRTLMKRGRLTIDC